MNKRKAGLATAVAVGLLLAPGCGKVADKAAKKVTEKAIEGQTGGKVDIGKDGKVTIKDSDGKTQVQVDSNGMNIKSSDGEMQYGTGAKLPDGWPSFLSLPKGATVVGSTRVNGDLSVNFTSMASSKDIVKAFDSKLKDAGWERKSEMSFGDTVMNSYEKGSSSVTISATTESDSGGKTTASVMYTAPKSDSGSSSS